MIMIDLHTHTNRSDGTVSPTDLLMQADHIGLAAIAITDHDTLAGFDAALPFAHDYNVDLICGVEVSTQLEQDPVQGHSLHVLGYFLRAVPGKDFRTWLASISSTRYERNVNLMKKLQASNIRISWDDFPQLGPARTARPHIARVLVEKGYVPDSKSAFDLYLSDSALQDVKRRVPSPKEAIQRICDSGGIASLAHPFRLCCHSQAARVAIIEELVRNGLGGLEVYHSEHSPQDIAFFSHVAEKFNLLPTGGSDYHGANKPDIHLGIGREGRLAVPDCILERIRESLAGVRSRY